MVFCWGLKTAAIRSAPSIRKALPISTNAVPRSPALAVRDTTVNGNERLFTQIRATVKSTSKAIDDRDANASLRLNSKFHSLVVESCGNPYLTVIMANLEKLILILSDCTAKNSVG